MRNTVPMLWTSVPVTMTGMAGHDPGISGHVRPESLVTLLRNTQFLAPFLYHGFVSRGSHVFVTLTGGCRFLFEAVDVTQR
ncbi:hypothetical protein [Limnohabitans sp. Hippo3]|uniref:hypothetical protein n=1 Tax=Limnohabitans sp. Hippo3 TaxID=1597956 RepID=UPI0011B24C7D|nr:hypothetical protein [Limnohabitans sp. Hippo3]